MAAHIVVLAHRVIDAKEELGAGPSPFVTETPARPVIKGTILTPWRVWNPFGQGIRSIVPVTRFRLQPRHTFGIRKSVLASTNWVGSQVAIECEVDGMEPAWFSFLERIGTALKGPAW